MEGKEPREVPSPRVNFPLLALDPAKTCPLNSISAALASLSSLCLPVIRFTPTNFIMPEQRQRRQESESSVRGIR